MARCAGYFGVASIGLCLLLRWLPPPTTAFMLYRHGQDLIESRTFRPIAYRWVASERISPHAYAAVIASEDQLFFEHFGFDFDSIESAVNRYKAGKRLRGASTISQQVAKNLFLPPVKSFVRKAFEAWFTLLLEFFWSKDRILTAYLNIAEFGDHIFGIEAASRHYFGVSARNLSRAQAALLAATLPNPLKLRADRPSAYLQRRQLWILRQMQNSDWQR